MSIKSNKVFNLAVIIFFLNISTKFFIGFYNDFWSSVAYGIFCISTIILSLLCALIIGLKITEYIKSEQKGCSLINLAANVFAIVGFVFLTVQSMGYTNKLAGWFNVKRDFITNLILTVFLTSVILKLLYFTVSFIKKKEITITTDKIKCLLVPNKIFTVGVFFAILNIYWAYFNQYSSKIPCFIVIAFMVISIIITIKDFLAKKEYRLRVLSGMSLISLAIFFIAFEIRRYFEVVSSYYYYNNIDKSIIATMISFLAQFISIAFFATALILKIIELSKKERLT